MNTQGHAAAHIVHERDVPSPPAVPPTQAVGVSKARLEALCDGVFAIVITLLVLELMGGPLAEAHEAAEVDAALLGLAPRFTSFVISFAIGGVFWVAHHGQLHWIRHTDRRHIWANIGFLLGVSLLPFSAALLGEHPSVRSAVWTYGANVVIVGAALLGQWAYAVRRGLLYETTPRTVVRATYQRLLAGQAMYWAAMAVALASPRWAFALYVTYVVLFVAMQLAPARATSPPADGTPASEGA